MAMPPTGPQRFGSRFGKRDSQSQETGKTVTFLRLSQRALTVVPWIENPCVGGSIPPQATKLISPSP